MVVHLEAGSAVGAREAVARAAEEGLPSCSSSSALGASERVILALTSSLMRVR